MAPRKKLPAEKALKLENAANAKTMAILARQARAKEIETIQNGLADVIAGTAGFGSSSRQGTQVNQLDTLQANLRWDLISNRRELISQAYAMQGLFQTLVDVPVDDGLRGGVDIKSEQLSEDEIRDLKVALEREDIINSVVGTAKKWQRAFGGGGVLILTDQDPRKKLNVEAIKEGSRLEFRPFDMWEMYGGTTGNEQASLESLDFGVDHYNYYGHEINKSRIIKMPGVTPPSMLRSRVRGWGMSVAEPLISSINQFLKSNNLAFEVLDEFKLDIFKIKGLSQALLGGQSDRIRERISLANQQKNFQNALVMDAEDDYLQKQLTFAGIADMMKEFRMQIASDVRMPLTKLFGISAAGFSSGEDDIENYNSMVESQIRGKSKYEILTIVELMCRKLFGYAPDDLSIEFKPLRVLSAEQEENVKTQKFARLVQAKAIGSMSEKEFKEACNKENLLSVQLDTSVDTLPVMGQEGGGESGAEGGEGPKVDPTSGKVSGQIAKEDRSKLDPKEAPQAKNDSGNKGI